MMHTNGEWKVNKWELKNSVGCQVEADGNVICTMAQRDHDANAKLIAAAPEMLGFIKDMAARYHNSVWISTRANELIAKATK